MWTPWKAEIAKAWKLCMAAIRNLEEDVLSLKTEFACGQNSTVSQLDKRVQDLAEAVQQLRSEMPCTKGEFSDLDRAFTKWSQRAISSEAMQIVEVGAKLKKKKRKYVKKNAAYWGAK